MFRAISVVLLAVSSGCGGSSSETPFPPEPLDVNLEAEDLATPQDAYKAARPEPARPEPAAEKPAPQTTAKPAATAKPGTKPAAPQKETPLF